MGNEVFVNAPLLLPILSFGIVAFIALRSSVSKPQVKAS